MTHDQARTLRLADVKRRQRNGNLDRVQLCTDRDWLVGQLEEALLQIRDLKRAMADAEVLGREGNEMIYAAAELLRMARTNDPVPASPPGR